MSEEEKQDIDLANRTQRALGFIYSTIKENGEISQFKEDVLYVISELLERLKQNNNSKLTATEIIVKNYNAHIQKEKERHLENAIRNKQSRIDKAIEYIENNRVIMAKIDIKELLQILKGENENESND